MTSPLVPPVGLLSPDRQRQLLTGLQTRLASTRRLRQELAAQQAAETEALKERLDQRRAALLAECRRRRQQALATWDDQDEQVVSQYETATLKTRESLNRLRARIRKAQRQQQNDVLHKVEARRQAVENLYARKKGQPAAQQRREVAQLDQVIATVQQAVDRVRTIVVRRLDHLPDVPAPNELPTSARPTTVTEAAQQISQAARDIAATEQVLLSSTPAKLVDTFWILPSVCGVFLLIWSGVSFAVVGPQPWLALAIGIVVAFILFLSLLGILQIPLRRQTRQIYPQAEQRRGEAEQAYECGKAVAMAAAASEAEELLAQRDGHLRAAERWKQAHFTEIANRLAEEEKASRRELEAELETIRDRFREAIERVDREMVVETNRVAEAIAETIRAGDEAAEEERRRQHAQQQAALTRLEARFRLGIARGVRRIADASQGHRRDFPEWNAIDPHDLPAASRIAYLPLGMLQIGGQLAPFAGIGGDAASQTPAGETRPDPLPDPLPDALPTELPVGLHRRLHAGLLIDCPSAQLEVAVQLVQGMLWKTLIRLGGGRVRLSLFDPVGRGQHFAGLIGLADHDPDLVHHRVWTGTQQIQARLMELTHHCEDVLQACLRDRYATIEDYNEDAGSLAEPYRVVAFVGLPAGTNDEIIGQLRALIESAHRCGTFVVLVRDTDQPDTDQPWPAGQAALEDPRLLRLRVDASGQIRHGDPVLGELPLHPVAPPPAALRERLLEAVGTASREAARVEIPLEQILTPDEAAGGDSATGLQLPIGSQGANRRMELRLGEGVKQHVLIAGETGSGKSTLLHSILTAGAHRYRPEQLQMYLLDFKKGGEFQIYAEAPLPHARVIGIESEREFGRSVLERLDRELQTRGEQFRAAGVQELAAYRKVSGQTLPRILLVIDEFQEIFVRDDRLAGECAMFLDRLVRQGRSFGMHVILSSQSLAGSYSLPRATLGQFAVRIALQCGESDAALILSDDNTAARLLSRPGEAIYNDASGLVEGNQPFQVAWLENRRHQALVAAIAQRDREAVCEWPPPVIFAGNRPARWTPALAEAATAPEGQRREDLIGLLGESLEIGPPTTLRLHNASGRNTLLVAPPEPTLAVLSALLPSLRADWQRRFGQDPQIILLDGNRAGAGDVPLPSSWLQAAGVDPRTIPRRDAEQTLIELQRVMSERLERESVTAMATGGEGGNDSRSDGGVTPKLLVITPLERFREFRQAESFQFSLDASGEGTRGPAALQAILRDGPQANLFTLLCCHSAETLTRWLPRSAHHDLELRLLARMSAADSSNLIDSPNAAELSPATMVLYDDADGRLQKFRYCDPPPPAQVQAWLRG